MFPGVPRENPHSYAKKSSAELRNKKTYHLYATKKFKIKIFSLQKNRKSVPQFRISKKAHKTGEKSSEHHVPRCSPCSSFF